MESVEHAVQGLNFKTSREIWQRSSGQVQAWGQCVQLLKEQCHEIFCFWFF
jgi:hypothetical protein